MSSHRNDMEFPELPGTGPVRFGCGALMGALIGFWVAVRFTGPTSKGRLIGWIVGMALLTGVLSTLFKDAFWRRESKRWWWWRLWW